MWHVIPLSSGVPLTASRMRQVEALAKGEPGRPSYEVAFIDWGNVETVPAASVRAMSPALKAVDAQAAPAMLAFVKARPSSETLRMFQHHAAPRLPMHAGLRLDRKARGSLLCPHKHLAFVTRAWFRIKPGVLRSVLLAMPDLDISRCTDMCYRLWCQIAKDQELSLAAARLLAAEADSSGMAARRMGTEPSPVRWAPRKLALLLQPGGQAGAFESVNARLLAAGLARLAPPRGRAVLSPCTPVARGAVGCFASCCCSQAGSPAS